ncbi:hypothetical protein [Cytobacillus firmus]|nr:hypothetical protein [Cytobacillus firmus]
MGIITNKGAPQLPEFPGPQGSSVLYRLEIGVHLGANFLCLVKLPSLL